MRALHIIAASTVLVALLACAGLEGGLEEVTGPKPVPGTGPVPAGSGGELPVPVPTPAPPPEPTGPDTCAPCSLLLEYSFDELRGGKACELCGWKNKAICDGWPDEDPTCESYDYLRNCIYARLGYGFETAEDWRMTFDQEPWYKPDPDFTWDRVEGVQKANATTLRALVKRKRCRR